MFITYLLTDGWLTDWWENKSKIKALLYFITEENKNINNSKCVIPLMIMSKLYLQDTLSFGVFMTSKLIASVLSTNGKTHLLSSVTVMFLNKPFLMGKRGFSHCKYKAVLDIGPDQYWSSETMTQSREAPRLATPPTVSPSSPRFPPSQHSLIPKANGDGCQMLPLKQKTRQAYGRHESRRVDLTAPN